MNLKKLSIFAKGIMPIFSVIIIALLVYIFLQISEVPQLKLWVIILSVFVLAFIVTTLLIIFSVMRKIHWYDEILDSIPFPLSITDKNRNWTFINKPVEDMLNLKRKDVIGKPCSNWGAGICNTDNCGINCLERGKNTTTFEQGGMNFKVDIQYLKDTNGKINGHIEVVQDISSMIAMQNAEATLVANIKTLSSAFVVGSQQVSDGSQSLAQGSTEQAASIQELSSSIAEISEKTKNNVKLTNQAAALAETIKRNAETGSHQMDGMMEAVNEINDASQSIGNVIKTIDDIAFQTNILALNAAVEAARAGQQGKGFAVVAEEVRSLAAKSAEAAKNTEALIANSIEKAQLGVKIADETADSLSGIVQGINESGQLLQLIAQASEEQSAGISQVNTGIDQVAQVVQQNSANAEESAAASQEIKNQSDKLSNLLAEFDKVGK